MEESSTFVEDFSNFMEDLSKFMEEQSKYVYLGWSSMNLDKSSMKLEKSWHDSPPPSSALAYTVAIDHKLFSCRCDDGPRLHDSQESTKTNWVMRKNCEDEVWPRGFAHACEEEMLNVVRKRFGGEKEFIYIFAFCIYIFAYRTGVAAEIDLKLKLEQASDRWVGKGDSFPIKCFYW